MVKIENEYGDRYTGKSGNAIYQGHYGRTIRRKSYQQNKTPSKKQLQTRQRFKEALKNIKTLNHDQILFLKKVYRILKEKNPRRWPVNWYNFAKLCYIKIPKFKILDSYSNEYQITYFTIYNVKEKTPSGTVIFDSGPLSSPDTGSFLETYSKIPNNINVEIEVQILPGVSHSYFIGEKETGLTFFDSLFFDSRYFT